jgi:dienelactone hydrolase
LVIITDVFGWELPNARLMADSYAKNGVTCYVPDLHQGDSLLAYEWLLEVRGVECCGL